MTDRIQKALRYQKENILYIDSLEEEEAVVSEVEFEESSPDSSSR